MFADNYNEDMAGFVYLLIFFYGIACIYVMVSFCKLDN